MNLNNLAALNQTKGNLQKAESLDRRALKTKQRALGPNHADVATSLNNLAVFYGSQGRYAEAKPLYQRALGILEESFGPEHPKVVGLLENYTSLLQRLPEDVGPPEVEGQTFSRIPRNTTGPAAFHL